MLGVKKKSAGLVRSESTNMGGTKKKIRSKQNLKLPSKEYYQIWTAYSSPSPTDETKDITTPGNDNFETLNGSAPPLPPRTSSHRPLERSHAVSTNFVPPLVHRQKKPKKVQNPEDTFGFELVDTDEDYRTHSTTSTTSSLSDADVSYFFLSYHFGYSNEWQCTTFSFVCNWGHVHESKFKRFSHILVVVTPNLCLVVP